MQCSTFQWCIQIRICSDTANGSKKYCWFLKFFLLYICLERYLQYGEQDMLGFTQYLTQNCLKIRIMSSTFIAVCGIQAIHLRLKDKTLKTNNIYAIGNGSLWQLKWHVSGLLKNWYRYSQKQRSSVMTYFIPILITPLWVLKVFFKIKNIMVQNFCLW